MKSMLPHCTMPKFSLDDDEPPLSDCQIQFDLIIDETIESPVDEREIRRFVDAACQLRGFSCGSIGLRLTDDHTIGQLNAKHLGHDYPTDVISFQYAAQSPHIDGELVVSVETAQQKASELGWPIQHELLLYIVHGVLHITGMDDHQRDDRAAMRHAEKQVFVKLGVDAVSRFGADVDVDTDVGKVNGDHR